MPTRRSCLHDTKRRKSSTDKPFVLASFSDDPRAVSALLDELDALAEELRNVRPEGSHFACVYIGTGLRIAADYIEHRRFELLTNRIAGGSHDR